MIENTETVPISEEVVLQLAPAESTALGAVTPTDVVEYAYDIYLPIYGHFKVVKSDTAWWMDVGKVAALFDAYKATATDEIACNNAKITIHQLRYFKETHPEFSLAKECCKNVGTTKFLNALHVKGAEDLPTIRWYLGKMHPDFKTAQDKVDPVPVVQQTVNVAVAQTQNVDTTKIEELLTRAAERFLADNGRAGGVPGYGGQVVAEAGS